MNITLIYFSQTDNTRRVAETMAETFRQEGHFTRTVSLKQATPQDAATCDLLGVGTACFSSQAPTPVKAFLSSLPQLDKRRVFVFATNGGAPGRVLYDLSSLLHRKGAEVIGGFMVRGEVHHPIPCLLGRFPNHPNKEELSHARRFAKAIADHITAGRPVSVATSHAESLKPHGHFYDNVALLSTDSFLRRLLPEPKLDPMRCDKCRVCMEECPMDNISLAPGPVLGQQCIRCYHCLAVCRRKAFIVDWGLSNTAVWLFYNTTFIQLFSDVKPGEHIYPEV